MNPVEPTAGTFVHFWVDDVCCEGKVEDAQPCHDHFPANAIIAVEGCGDDDRGPRGIISAADYARILEPYRTADSVAVHAEALRLHVRRVQSDLSRQFQERRVCALRGQCLPVPVVAAGWLNAVPTRREWKELEVTETGVSLESLARAGLLKTTLEIWPPAFNAVRPIFNETVNEFESVVWAPEFERAVAQAVAPYVAALKEAEAEMLGRALTPATEPPCCP